MRMEQDYARDLTEIRSMMERSSKFLLLSGGAGIMAGLYALAGAYIAYAVYYFNPQEAFYSGSGSLFESMKNVIWLGAAVLAAAASTAVYFSYRKAEKRGEHLWNPTSRRLLFSMLVPLVAGAVLILFMIAKGLIGLIVPFSLMFYGLALYNASKFTSAEVRMLGLSQLALGLLSAWFMEYGMLLWALGFGIFHIVYGIYIFYRYEK